MGREPWVYVSEGCVIQPIDQMTDDRLVAVFHELLSKIDRGEPLRYPIGDPVRMLGAMSMELERRGLAVTSERNGGPRRPPP